MRVLVTGGSGFTGRRVVGLLVASGHDVVGLARSESAVKCLSDLGAEWLRGNLDDPESIDDAFILSRADALLNIASLGFGHAPGIIAAAEEARIERTVFVSTTAIFTSIGASSKAIRVEAERQIRNSGLDWTIVRPTMIYGAPGDRNMSRLLSALRRSPVFPLPGGGRRLQQPVHVDDLAEAIVRCLNAPHVSKRAYEVAGPDPLPFRTVVEQAAEAVHRRAVFIPLPIRPLLAGLKLYERMARSPRIKVEQLARLAEDKAFDIGPARNDLGYEPRPFDVGIRAEAALLC